MVNRVKGIFVSLGDAISKALFAAREFRRKNFFPLIGGPILTAIQAEILRSQGINVCADGKLYYVTRLSDFMAAIRFFYERGVAGWGCYEDHLIRFGICTKEEFQEAVKARMDLAPGFVIKVRYAT